jgi:hypothetical protein
MAGAVRPGGRVILPDDDYDGLRLWPEPPGFASLWHAYQRTYDRHGNDPIIRPTCVHDVSHLSFLADAPASLTLKAVVRNIASIIDEAIDDIVGIGLPCQSVTATLDALIDWSKEPDPAVWFGMSWAEAVRPV